MLNSLINSKFVYNSLPVTFLGDEKTGAEVYSINICGDLIVAFGVINVNSDYNIMYFYIYLLMTDKTVERIGLFEFEYDEYYKTDITIDKLIDIITKNNIQPILYTNSTCDTLKNKKLDIKNINELDAITPSQNNEIYWQKITDKSSHAEKYWLNKLPNVKDKHYKQIYNAGRGDCFFYAIASAWNSLTSKELNYTVKLLRKIIVDNITRDAYQSYHNAYVFPDDDIYNEYKFNKKYGTTFETFKQGILTSEYWIDETGLKIIEQYLNIKVIVLTPPSGERVKTHNPIPDCGGETRGYEFTPDYFVMLNLEGGHYELVTYNNQSIFKFSNLPKIIKDAVFDRCVVSGKPSSYGEIPDFKNYNK
jgi:hypothetical protein